MSSLLIILVMFPPYPLQAIDAIAAIVSPAVGGEAHDDENQE